MEQNVVGRSSGSLIHPMMNFGVQGVFLNTRDVSTTYHKSYAARCNLRDFFFFFFYEWEYRTGTMCPFSSLHPLRKGKEV